ncbi:hypothetical protein [Planococcus sp. ISL-110]|uniref:hypothetical protein n=1 Tax=Planococcus sp. ISL-110 TaxID=2819167 RepID=UPI001BE69CE3|nr:hypothetical protein [Planococcus sp. ISL-110]MBT2569640.1 hypothetical protein [Planococcus sp. ISL-110]
MSANKVFSKVEGLELIMERSFNAPKELVFSMFIESDHIADRLGYDRLQNGSETRWHLALLHAFA